MNKYISDTAEIGDNVEVGYFTVIEENVKIGDNVFIGNNCEIKSGSKIGDDVTIDSGTIIGKLPMKASRSATTKESEWPPADIGDNCTIGANVVIYSGTNLGNDLLIADQATIREEVSVDDYTIVGRGVSIENECSIGKCCKLETNCYITAYSELGDFVFISPCVATSNDNYVGRSKERLKHFKGVTVERGGRIGVNATILPGKTVREDALVGAGTVVTKDIPSKRVYVGSPAKEFGPVPEKQLLENQEWKHLEED